MGASLLLSPGFRFHPTDVELVMYYLRKKILGKKFWNKAIAEINIYKYAPWDLPDKSFLKSRDLKWYFFCPIEKKYACGARINRATEYGFWKTTGKDRPVTYEGKVVGMIKTLVFHRGRAPKGDRTDWVMHEYRLEDKNLSDIKDLYVLCMIFEKEGPGPRNGAQYGATFIEDEWTDGEEESHVNVGPSEPNSLMASSSRIPQKSSIDSSSESCVSVLPLQRDSSTDVGLNNPAAPMNKGKAIGSSSTNKGKAVGSSSESHISDVLGPRCNLLQPVPLNDVGVEKLPIPDDDDLLSLLYRDGGPFTEDENGENKVVNNVDQRDPRVSHFMDGAYLFEDLPDLVILGDLGVPAYYDEIFNGDFLEQMDLSTPLGFDCNNNGNLGSSSYLVNAVDEVGTYSALSGETSGLEDHLFDPCTSAQNHSLSVQPEVVYHRVNPDTVSGSQNLQNTK